MNKGQMIEKISADFNLTKKAAGEILDSVLESIVSTVKKGEDVSFVGFGTFTSSRRAARTGRNPQTGADLKIAAVTVPKFRAGQSFKDAVAKTKKK